MAPDRGLRSTYQSIPGGEDIGNDGTLAELRMTLTAEREFLAQHAAEGQNFTLRGIVVGLGVGLIICFSNMYFGLQTGWISGMAMPSSLIGFAFFKTLSKHLDLPFTPVENVLVQTVAGSMGTMPLGCGLVGVMPALNYMLLPEEGGPIFLSLWKLTLWALGLCFFGVVFAVPLRRQVIIREKLKFPSGTATALMIGVLHGKQELPSRRREDLRRKINQDPDEINQIQVADGNLAVQSLPNTENSHQEMDDLQSDQPGLWIARLKLLILSFGLSGIYTLGTYFFPVLRNIPLFGWTVAESWLWTLNPSLAYVGQGIIMGPATTLHMLLGAIVGWGILSPLAKQRGWAPGPVDDWETGSRGWIVWVSLAVMLADAIISLGYIAGQPIILHGPHFLQKLLKCDWTGLWFSPTPTAVSDRLDESRQTTITRRSSDLDGHDLTEDTQEPRNTEMTDPPDLDAPPEHLVGARVVWIGLVISIAFCVACIHITFGDLVPLYATITAVFMALILSVMGVRALGETDLNPVSGISKLAQLFFALIIPQSNKNSVLINLIAGAVSEAGALQAGDLMQDLKTGHLLGAAPNAQFWGQIIGSAVGAVASALIYRLYTSVYEIPGDLFQVPTGYVWIFTARLVTGKGLPPMAWQWALGAAIIFTMTTCIRISGNGKAWHPYVPGGIAVAVGMYNVPSFTLARTIGGLLHWYWRSYRKREETPIVVIASGLILGEGVLSIANLLMASLHVPHL